MAPEALLFLCVLLAALGLFLWQGVVLLRRIRQGKPEQRVDQPWKRLGVVLKVAFGQSKLLREPFAGILHFFIFWGFVILLAAVTESIGEGLAPGFSLAFLGPLYGPLVLLEDCIGVLVVVAVTVSIVRRLVAPPPRLRVEGHSRWDALLILGLILAVMVTMFGQNAARILLGRDETGGLRIVSAALAGLFAEGGPERAGLWFHLFFWAHILSVLGFLNYLPSSKHLHVLTSVPNVYCSDLGPRGSLKPMNLSDETVTKFGATDVADLSWKQILDGYTCTECGRCTSVCPASGTGKSLNPRKIIVDVRARATGRERAAEGQLLDTFITEKELWACTTCMACVQECPVMIEHVSTIVDLRRGLVLNESRFPAELHQTFSNLERNFTPWGFAHASRGDWAEGLNVPLLADVGHADVLFWVGCAGAYDARYRKVSRAFAQLLTMAGVDYAILGTEERCTGDPARRMGNEYLAQTLMTENIATLNRYGVTKIVVTCPHCLQALGKEYRAFGGTYAVEHHSQFLRRLIEEGRLTLSSRQKARIAFHDPCYLGRYHEEYDAPRDVLSRVEGLEQVEMKRSRDRSFCCGAGGGRMWMEEREGKRINIERTEEALATGAGVIGTGCPFCMTMLSDGVKEKERAESVAVKDIAEIVLDACRA